MKIIDGQLPSEVEWRAMLVLEPGQEPGIAWQLGRGLARANRGDLVIAIQIPDREPSRLDQALATAASLRERVTDHNGNDLFVVVVEDQNRSAALVELVKRASIDLLLIIATRPDRYDYRDIPCAVGMIRMAAPATPSGNGLEDGTSFDHILLPTSGGPNSAHALGLTMLLRPEVQTTALYVATAGLGDNEEALGKERLRQVLDFVHAGEGIHTRLLIHDSVASGIVAEACDGKYDLVVIGASEESRLDHVIFGNIPAAVVAETEKPVMVLRQNNGPLSSAITALDWRLHTIFPRKSIGERAEIYARIRRGARPEMPFFVLITLSALIASLGLIVNSPAVVIGAMLVAPLMSPMIGTGLAIVLGDTRFLRLALGAVGRGTLLAILVGFLTGLLVLNRPFSDEIAARTQPNLFDLGIAIFSGAAGAYALSFSQAAGALPGVAIAAALVPPLATVGVALAAGLAALAGGRVDDGLGFLTDSLGALLLFTTNFIAISTAAALVFFVLGFRPTPSKKARREVQRRSSVLALTLLLIVTFILGLTSYVLARESAVEGRIYAITDEQVTEFLGARVDETNILGRSEGILNLSLTVISPGVIPHSQVVELQQRLADAFRAAGIASDVALTISVIRVTELDPLVPPTPTPTP